MIDMIVALALLVVFLGVVARFQRHSWQLMRRSAQRSDALEKQIAVREARL